MPDNRPGQQPGQGQQPTPSHDKPQTGQHDPSKQQDDPSKKQQPGHQTDGDQQRDKKQMPGKGE